VVEPGATAAELGPGSGARSKSATQTIADLDVMGQPFELADLDFDSGVVEPSHKELPVQAFHLTIGLARTGPVWTDHHPGRGFYLSQASLVDGSATAPTAVIEQDEPGPVAERCVQMGPRRMPARVSGI
jgi:hypothetical protein